MTEHALPEHPKGREDVVFRQLDDEWVLFDPRANKMHVLNLSASLVWVHCTGDDTQDDIAKAVSDSFSDPAPPDEIARDVRDAVSRFQAESLLE